MDKITESLVALGTTAEEVAASLEARGIKGVLEMPSSCPIARYIRTIINSDELVQIYAGSTFVMVQGEKISTPKAVELFVEQFDECKFPFLIGE